MHTFKQFLEQLKRGSVEDLKKCAWKFREELENYYEWSLDKRSTIGACLAAAPELAKVLQQKGYDAERVGGYYTDVSDQFELVENPEEFDGKWKHWWVVVKLDGKEYIVDVAADQFHPGEEDDYRVVIEPRPHADYSF